AGASDAVVLLRRLIRIRGSADRDVLRLGVAAGLGFVGIFLRDIAGQERRGILFHENLLLEFAAIDFHVFVGVAGIAVFAAKLAAAIWIDGPFEGDTVGFTAVQDGFNWQKEIFGFLARFAFRFAGRRIGSEASNAHQWRRRSLELWRGAIRRGALRTSLAPASLTPGKGRGFWFWAWLIRAKR